MPSLSAGDAIFPQINSSNRVLNIISKNQILKRMKFKPPPKRIKVNHAPSSSTSHCTPVVNLPSEKRDTDMTPMKKAMVHETQTSHVSQRIQQARNYAVAQAQQDGCTGNFKIFDSPFGNYLVPVIPTRSELGE